MAETMIETKVTYTLAYEGKVCIIEHVPARVCEETGEQFFSPETVEHVHALIKGHSKPTRIIEAPVFEYA
jgi:YgiT-type zinc finger domain-containing protein